MNSLSNALEALLRFVAESGDSPPSSEIRIVEVAPDALTDERGRVKVKFDALPSPEQFQQRFEAILHSGLPWVNVTCYGMERGALLVGVELPRTPEHRAQRTSVNLSGPSKAVLESDWRADAILAIE